MPRPRPACPVGPAAPEPAHHPPFTPRRLTGLYRAYLVDTGREDHFLAWTSFVAMFALVRFITHSIRAHRFRWLFRNVSGRGGRHIHHLVFGIIGLLVGGYLATAYHPQRPAARRMLALVDGASAALTVDEFALWLDLEDVYWTQQGRVSVDAAVLTGGAMAMGGVAWHLLAALARDAWLVARRSARR